MKKLAKKIATLFLATSMVWGTAVAASAATSDYSVVVKDKTVQIVRNGKAASYNAKSTDVKVMTDPEGDMLICFTDVRGTSRAISLGTQTTLNISGSMNSLSLASSLSAKVDTAVGSGSKIKTMTVSSRGDVSIKGNISSLIVNGASDVIVSKGSNISYAKVSSTTATLNAVAGSDVDRVVAATRSNVTGDGIGTKVSLSDDDDDKKKDYDDDDDYDDEDDDDDDDLPVTTRVTDITIYYSSNSSDNVYLSDITDILNEHVEAYYYDRDGDETTVRGKARWNTSDKKLIDTKDLHEEDFECSFVFNPSNDKYRSARDSITVRVRARA